MAGLIERVPDIVIDTILAIVFFVIGMLILHWVTKQPFGFHGSWHQISGDITFCAMCAGFPLGLRIVNSFRVRNLTLWSFRGDYLELLPMMIVLNLGKYVLIIGFAFILGVFALIYTSIHHAVVLIRMLLLGRKIRSLQAMPAELQAVLPAEQLAVEPQVEVREDIEHHREG